MENKKYKTIVVDPPWKYPPWGVSSPTHRPNLIGKVYPLPYPSMSISEISNLPIDKLTADDCDLYLWTTEKYLPYAFKVLESWGFKYCVTLVWCKKPMGARGGLYTPTTEFIILGRKGKSPKVKRITTTWFLVKRPHNNHSKKPEFFQEMIEKMSYPPRLELFARRKREGWDVWGNEVESDIQLTGVSK